MMTRQEELKGSRHGLLQAIEANRSSSDSEYGLDNLDLDAVEKSKQASRHNGSWFSKRPPWSSGYTFDHNQDEVDRELLGRKRLKGWHRSRKTCFLVILILALGMITVVGSGALWVYKSAPRDGVGLLYTLAL